MPPFPRYRSPIMPYALSPSVAKPVWFPNLSFAYGWIERMVVAPTSKERSMLDMYPLFSHLS